MTTGLIGTLRGANTVIRLSEPPASAITPTPAYAAFPRGSLPLSHLYERKSCENKVVRKWRWQIVGGPNPIFFQRHAAQRSDLLLHNVDLHNNG